MSPRRVHIIRAGKSDAQLLLELEQLLFPEDPWTEGMIREELASPYSDYLLALAPDEETRAEDDDPSQVRGSAQLDGPAPGFVGASTSCGEGSGSEQITHGGRQLESVGVRSESMTEAGGLVFGYGGIKTLGDSADIMTIGILPQARRTGLGRMLVKALLEEAGRRGARTVFLEVRESNAGARVLYTSEGFREVGRIRRYFHNPLEDAITMLKELESN